MSQSNEGDSPVKGGKEPVKGLQRTITCTRWLGGNNHVHTPSKEHQTRDHHYYGGKILPV